MRAQTLVRAKANNHLIFLFFSVYLFSQQTHGAEVICVHLALSLLDSFFLSLFDFHDSHTQIDLNIGDMGEIKRTADDNLGDLQLGRVRQEYIIDPDLRVILSCTVLDADKMIPYHDQELFLITSVVYSKKFEVVGKRNPEVCALSPSIFVSSDCFQLKWLASSRVGGELVFSNFSFSWFSAGNRS